MMRAPILLSLLLSFLSVAHAQDAKAGEKNAAMCIGCHGIEGYQSSFPEVHKVPMISGQNAKYIAAALAAYKKGERKHPTMRSIAGSLSDKDMADLGAFYEQQPGKPAELPAQPAAAGEDVAKLLQRGACESCHGKNYSAPSDASYPKLAGQHADYLYVALKAYKTEGNANVGRANVIMAGQAKQFTNAEMRRIADYLASLPGSLKVVKESYFR